MSKPIGTKQVILFLLILILSLFITAYNAYANEPEVGMESKAIISGTDSWQNPLIPPTKQLQDTEYTSSSTAEATNLVELKSAIQQGFIQRQSSFSIHYIGDTANLTEEINRLLDAIFTEDEYLKYSMAGYSYKYFYTTNEANINFITSYISTREQEDFVEQQVSLILAQIIRPEMSTLEKVKTINDYIVLNNEYSYTTSNPDVSPHSAYALLKEGNGVCQGYALLAYKMLKETEISVRIVVGEVEKGTHAWNLVQINQQWYHLDVTWNDPMPDRPGQVNYNYFLKNDAISSDHSWNSQSYPPATDDSFGYFDVMLDTSSQGQYIYYSHQGDGNQLYRSSIDGTEQQKLNNNRSYYITIAGDWIYFSNYSNRGYLYKIRTSGNDENLVAEEHAINIYVENNVLYYTHVVSSSTRIEKNIPLNPPDECFIATACFGSKYEPAVVLLRKFRDDFLIKTTWGRSFVNFYYRTSPPYAAQIADSPGLKEFTRLLLLPFISLIYLLYHPLLATSIILVLIMTLTYKRRKLTTNQ